MSGRDYCIGLENGWLNCRFVYNFFGGLRYGYI